MENENDDLHETVSFHVSVKDPRAIDGNEVINLLHEHHRDFLDSNSTVPPTGVSLKRSLYDGFADYFNLTSNTNPKSPDKKELRFCGCEVFPLDESSPIDIIFFYKHLPY